MLGTVPIGSTGNKGLRGSGNLSGTDLVQPDGANSWFVHANRCKITISAEPKIFSNFRELNGGPGEIRTHDLCLRRARVRQLFYFVFNDLRFLSQGWYGFWTQGRVEMQPGKGNASTARSRCSKDDAT